MREHGSQKYKKEGCRCDICRAGHTVRMGAQRARRKASAAPGPASPRTVREPSQRRSQSAPGVGFSQVQTTRASQSPQSPVTAPAAPATPRERDPEPSPWTPGLWETELVPLLGMPGINAEGYVGTVTLDPPYDYPEYLDLLESCREYISGFPLEWEYEPGKGVHIWRTDEVSNPEPSPVFVIDTPVRNIDAPITLTVKEKIRYSFSRNTQGMCQIQLVTDNTSCHMFVGFNEYEWKFMVSGYPACQDHYTAIQTDYPERCEYVSTERKLASAPKIAQPRSNPVRVIAPSVPVSHDRNPESRYNDYPKWG